MGTLARFAPFGMQKWLAIITKQMPCFEQRPKSSRFSSESSMKMTISVNHHLAALLGCAETPLTG
jgi:hypothetical protein